MSVFNGKQADREMEERLAAIKDGIFLHVCCGPCATAVIERILPFVRPTLYYYNPNIFPESEYVKRLEELKKVATYFGVELIAEPYDEREFLIGVKGLEMEKEGGARCEACFSLRLEKTAKRAKELGYTAICTTLTVSPHKNSGIINLIGEKSAEEEGVVWIPSDFKKRGGYLRSVEISEQLGLYRQKYCGCRYAQGDKTNDA